MNAGFLNVYLSFAIKLLFRKVCVIWKSSYTVHNKLHLQSFLLFFFTILGIVERKFILYITELICLHFLQFRWWKPWLFKFSTVRSKNSQCDMKVISILFVNYVHVCPSLQQNSTLQCLPSLNCTQNSRRGWIQSLKNVNRFCVKIRGANYQRNENTHECASVSKPA